MKSLKEVIKLKCELLSTIDLPLYSLHPGNLLFYSGPITIYESKKTFTTKDELTLLEEIVPLIVYLCSCVTFSGIDYTGLLIKLKFDTSDLVLDNNIDDYYEDLFKNPLQVINDTIEETNSFGYCFFFTDTFKLELILRREDRDQSDNEITEEEEKPDPIPINDIKTFKLEQCVICLENKPNVLFCNCCHICICETCVVKKFTNCPMCKKENTILRIIE